MKHLFRIGGALLLYIAFICFVGREKAKTTAAQPTPAAGAAAVSTLAPVEDPLFAKQTEERIRQLTLQAAHRAKVEKAAKEMAASRRQIQTAAFSAWKRHIETHQAAYVDLKAQAERSPQKEVPCTLCDGFSYTPCVACPARNGKCVSCNGSGRRGGGDEYCASCLGTGKCYLCTGSGKMLCPFCDDAMITTTRPPPSNFPPAH